MKTKYVLFILFLLIAISVYVIEKHNQEQRRIWEELESKEFSQKQLERQKQIDSLDKVLKEKEQKKIEELKLNIDKLKPLFNITTDEFENCSWVKPKSIPQYRNMNGIYCYFQIKNNIPTNFRFVYQYYANEWLFIKKIKIKIDDSDFVTTIEPEMKTDNNTKIWEWCDESVRSNNSISPHLIQSIGKAKSVKLKLIGTNYAKEINLSKSQIKSIKDTYEYYLALGGKF